MELRIIRPEGENKFDIEWVELETPVGNFIIHSGHAPTLLTLLPDHDLVFQLKTGERESLHITDGGVVEITRERVTVIL